MSYRSCSLFLTAGLLLAGCQGDPARESREPDEAAPAATAPAADPELDPEDPSILRRPFTAGQIRDHWVPGLTLKLRRTLAGRQTIEKWEVATADTEGAEIVYRIVGTGDEPPGEPSRQRALWTELSDHATFAAAHARREAVTRETPLGSLEGWLYTVREDAEGTVTELFFARTLPGPPVHMRTTRGEELVMELVQLEHRRPE